MDALCEQLADLSRLPVERPRQIEATARGAAWLVGGQSRAMAHDEADIFRPSEDPSLAARFEAFRAEMERYAA